MIRQILDGWELIDKLKLRLNERKERRVEQKIVRAIKENRNYTPEELAEKTGISCNDVEDILTSLDDRGFISILSGGSARVVQFEILKDLDELL